MAAGTTRHAGGNRVIRGGSWNNNGRNLRSAYRNANHADDRNNNVGFRLVAARRGAPQCA
ncbi:MAG: SUMF1/EgtB/PvdO family nonheme iron enzyme [Pseudomonadota bacterium]